MKKTILVCILVCTLLLGCGNKKVNYDMPTGESNNSTEAESTDWNDVHWVERIPVDDFEVKIDLKPVIYSPSGAREEITSSDFKVVACKKITIDSAYKEKAVKALLGNTTIYKYDEDNLPSFVVDAEIKCCELALQEGESTFYQNELERFYKLKANAPSNYVIADNYEGDSYLGFIEDVPYVVGFSADSIGYGICGDYYFNDIYQEIYSHRYDASNIAKRETMYNQFVKTMETLGLHGIYDKNELCLSSSPNDIGGSENAPVLEEAPYMNYNGTQFGNIRILENNSNCFYASMEKDRLIMLSISTPVDVYSVEENINILSFNQLKETIKYYLENGKINISGEYDGWWQHMELIYKCVEGKDGEINYIPAWELGFCTINAIDGTLIN